MDVLTSAPFLWLFLFMSGSFFFFLTSSLLSDLWPLDTSARVERLDSGSRAEGHLDGGCYESTLLI